MAELQLDEDASVRFPSLAAYDVWQEGVDRQRAALGEPLPGIAS